MILGAGPYCASVNSPGIWEACRSWGCMGPSSEFRAESLFAACGFPRDNRGLLDGSHALAVVRILLIAMDQLI